MAAKSVEKPAAAPVKETAPVKEQVAESPMASESKPVDAGSPEGSTKKTEKN